MLRRDCRHFPGDRPCDFHKRDLVTCDTCAYYKPRGTTILVIKIEALGDVLRTTSVLPALRARYEPCHVTWLTSDAATELFVGNPLVDRVVSIAGDYLPALLSRSFDVVINPDAAIGSCELASIAKARAAFGYRLSPDGVVVGLNRVADLWLEMGASDPAKRTNTKTYQEILHGICSLPPAGQHIVLNLTPEEDEQRGDLAREIGLNPDGPVVALNTGAGKRWPLKKWTADGFIDLVGRIVSGSDWQVVLLGGDLERSTNSIIESRFEGRVVNPPVGDLRRLIRTVDLCDAVVTGDTLALHVALGLGKRVVALFGPTSPAEIDMYGLGTKVVPDLDCTCCYNSTCERVPSCMDVISASQVYEHLLGQMEIAAGCGRAETGQGGSPGREGEECMVGEPTADW
jgi:ADP-heptose:LPS heptosyltransferase